MESSSGLVVQRQDVLIAMADKTNTSSVYLFI